MGNAKSVQKDRKREHNNGVDDCTEKNKKPDAGNAVGAPKSRLFAKQLPKHLPTNPFIIFYLQLRSKKPQAPVTVIARAAGKLWVKMPPEQRQKYIDLATAEKQRRQKRRRKRKPGMRRRK